MQAPKNGFFYVLDRLTGEFISAAPFANVNWATHIDPKTGRPVETPEARYGKKGARLSPSPVGAHHWPPMAYNPDDGPGLFPGSGHRVELPGRGRTRASSRGSGTPAPGSARPPERPRPPVRLARPPRQPLLPCRDGAAGSSPGIPIAQKERWRNEFNPSGGVLSTASNLIFVGDGGGTLFALDAVTGKTLWEHKMLPGVATPVTYELNGKQFVAVLSGTGNGRVFAFALDAAGGKP